MNTTLSKSSQTQAPKLELLAPAGGFDQLRYAIYYGADAVYLAADKFGLRARASNFSLEELPQAVDFAHERGVSVHVTCNALMSHEDLPQLPAYFETLEAAGVDAVIVSDLGALRLARKHAPNLELHVSTQASCANASSAMVWYELGARRIVCAREMSLEDIKQMRQEIPEDLELEIFAHGAMCMAVSGRCLISDYLTGRSGNKGNCTQPCRWKYTLQEEFRPGQNFPIEEDDRGSYIMNAQDMNMLAHLQEIKDAGVNSIKIEGRNKKAFYVATVINAYRQVLDGKPLQDFAPELDKISHRPYGTGFYFGRATQAPEQNGYLQEYLHAATVEECEEQSDGTYLVTIRCHNRLRPGDKVEVLSPNQEITSFEMPHILWEKSPENWEAVEAANRSMERYIFFSERPYREHDIFRLPKGE